MKIIRTKDFITFTKINGSSYDYDIHTKLLMSLPSVVEWINHLRQKNWWCKQVEHDFISEVENLWQVPKKKTDSPQ